ncbi:MAG: GGDEF domain-containing protein, partial [Eubacteriales bacterium]|nr:GGDEF domain-containing protein [Eubacteriales bacterium]
RMIIYAHIAMTGLIALIIITAVLLVRQAIPKKAAYPLQYVAFFAVLALGIAATAIDQRVTTNITPYIGACIIAGTVILIRPIYSLLIYLFSYAAFFFLISTTMGSSEMLWSNGINGMTVTAISFLISVIMWRNNYIHINQQRHIKTQQTQLGKINKELKKMAYLDSLTGLPNRRHFDRIIKKEKALMMRKSHDSCLVMLDIDYFKKVNDQYGHPSGDKLLTQVSDLLLQHLRKYDTICRLGGDEFVLLLPQTNLSDAATVAENLRTLIESSGFSIGGNTVHVTASFGVAKLTGTDDCPLVNQYMIADHALYLAKQSGRNQVETWKPKDLKQPLYI